MPVPTRRVSVENAGNADGLSPALVRRTVVAVLDAEAFGDAEFCVTFLSGQRMRWLNRRTFGRDRATDVIAFGMPHQGITVGDVYVCPSVAARTARTANIPVRDELVRLVIHGTLHALGFDHPFGEERVESRMWSLQEHYTERIVRNLR